MATSSPPGRHEYDGGFNTYGEGLGLIVANQRRPRPPGDPANATTFRYPVRYAVLDEIERDNLSDATPDQVAAARAAVAELAAAGVLGIVSACTGLGEHQAELAAASPVPVLASSLLQLPLLYELFGRTGPLGLLTARADAPRPELLAAVGATAIPLAVISLEDRPAYRRAALDDDETLDTDPVEAEVVAAARELIEREPAIRALVLEPADLPSYARAIQRATGRPVFDLVTQADLLYAALRAPSFPLPDLEFGRAWWRARW